MNKNLSSLIPLSLLIVVLLGLAVVALAQGDRLSYLPIVQGVETTPAPSPTPTPMPGEPMVEFRGLWVTRFDWTEFASASPQKIDEIVDNAADAGFNVLLFQVRGIADAFYTPGLEPWSSRMTGQLGQDPGWDPLTAMIMKAHQRQLEVHAYINVYPLWTGCTPPVQDTQPSHLYFQLLAEHGETDGKANGLQWEEDGPVTCSPYLRASPASVFVDDHIAAVARDIVQRYDVDGLHLDHMRYAGRSTSCDPVSEERFGADCFANEDYGDWQREQVNGTAQKIYEQVVPLKPGLWITSTAWPVHQDHWGWGARAGYDDYYQDSKAWLAQGHMDAITPMIYTGSPNCNTPYFWTRERWQTLVEDFQASRSDRYIVPGIGVAYCTADDFAEIEARIEMGRAAGVAGHGIFSYSSLLAEGYFDNLAQGPYQRPAILPTIEWHP